MAKQSHDTLARTLVVRLARGETAGVERRSNPLPGHRQVHILNHDFRLLRSLR